MRALIAFIATIGLGIAMSAVALPAKAGDWSVGIGISLPGVIVVPSEPGYGPPPPSGYYVPPQPPAYVVVPPYYAPPYPIQVVVPPYYDGGYYWHPRRHHDADKNDDH